MGCLFQLSYPPPPPTLSSLFALLCFPPVCYCVIAAKEKKGETKGIGEKKAQEKKRGEEIGTTGDWPSQLVHPN